MEQLQLQAMVGLLDHRSAEVRPVVLELLDVDPGHLRSRPAANGPTHGEGESRLEPHIRRRVGGDPQQDGVDEGIAVTLQLREETVIACDMLDEVGVAEGVLRIDSAPEPVQGIDRARHHHHLRQGGQIG